MTVSSYDLPFYLPFHPALTVYEPGARLVEPTLGTLVLSRANGWSRVRIDYGSPAVREVTQDRILADGTIDDTTFHGSRAVSVTALLMPGVGTTRREQMDRLRAFTRPDLRPVLQFDEDGVTRQVRLRGVSGGAPRTGLALDVQAAWIAPDGVLEAVEDTTVEVPAVSAASNEGGLGMPLRMPVAFPAGSTFNAVALENPGTARTTLPLLQLWGPCANPRLTNITTGRSTSLVGLTLNADQYAEVDPAARTITLNGRRAESLYSRQEWGVHSFWALVPGTNLLRYEPVDFGDTARAVVKYRERIF